MIDLTSHGLANGVCVFLKRFWLLQGGVSPAFFDSTRVYVGGSHIERHGLKGDDVNGAGLKRCRLQAE